MKQMIATGYSKGDKQFLSTMARALKWCADHPNGLVRLSWCESEKASEMRRVFQRRIDIAINKRGGLHITRGRKDCPEYQASLQRDRSAICDYRLHRIVRSGSGLETPEGRRIAPDVHATFRDFG